ncbi:hypothetical protein HGA91_02060 [candidate division WWE3 bacterium]|nr:hypothetical protein [candidate division WWE3 bacterium]
MALVGLILLDLQCILLSNFSLVASADSPDDRQEVHGTGRIFPTFGRNFNQPDVSIGWLSTTALGKGNAAVDSLSGHDTAIAGRAKLNLKFLLYESCNTLSTGHVVPPSKITQ